MILRSLFPSRFAARSAAEHLGGIWAIDPATLEAIASEAIERARQMTGAELRALMAEADAERQDEARPLYELRDGVAMIPVDGVLVSGDASCLRMMGTRATSYQEIAAGVRRALADPQVQALELVIDSPGGTTQGLAELATGLHEARTAKPLRARALSEMASAAYWLGSQAEHITASESTMVGSIGVYARVMDASKAYEARGLKVHVLRSAAQKGLIVDGAPVTDAALAQVQGYVDSVAAMFVGAVARGRGISIEKAQELATGEAWLAGQARERGLIDAMFTPSLLSAEGGGGNTMSDKKPSVGAGPSPEELAQMQARLEAAEKAAQEADARAKKAEAAAEMLKMSSAKREHDARMEVLDRHQAAGRILPADRPQLERAAEAFSAAELDRFIADNFRVRVQSTASGQDVPRQLEQKSTGDDAAFARIMGCTPSQVAEASNVRQIFGVTRDRVLEDGRRVNAPKED